MEEKPFAHLNITDDTFLFDLQGRSLCVKCRKSRMYYCYECYCETDATTGRIPRVKLPVKVDIIKHPSEVTGKSTSGHGPLLAPEDCRVYTYPDIPHYEDTSNMVLVFPGKDSITLSEYIEKFSSEIDTDNTISDLKETHSNGKRSSDERNHCIASKKARNCRIDKVVFIDSTWHQCFKISSDERLKKLQRIELKSRDTYFWRHQAGKPRSYLATIEAVYYFSVDYHRAFLATAEAPYNGQYDDLLFMFAFTYARIRNLFEGGTRLKAYDHLRGGINGKKQVKGVEAGGGAGDLLCSGKTEESEEKVVEVKEDVLEVKR